jgi:hypothetical protein
MTPGSKTSKRVRDKPQEEFTFKIKSIGCLYGL